MYRGSDSSLLHGCSCTLEPHNLALKHTGQGAEVHKIRDKGPLHHFQWCRHTRNTEHAMPKKAHVTLSNTQTIFSLLWTIYLCEHLFAHKALFHLVLCSFPNMHKKVGSGSCFVSSGLHWSLRETFTKKIRGCSISVWSNLPRRETLEVLSSRKLPFSSSSCCIFCCIFTGSPEVLLFIQKALYCADHPHLGLGFTFHFTWKKFEIHPWDLTCFVKEAGQKHNPLEYFCESENRFWCLEKKGWRYAQVSTNQNVHFALPYHRIFQDNATVRNNSLLFS